MEVGSLVELTKPANGMYKDVEYPQMQQVYTVRDFEYSGITPSIRLEEIVNPKQQWRHFFGEMAFAMSYFREIQPPMDISELMEDSRPALSDTTVEEILTEIGELELINE